MSVTADRIERALERVAVLAARDPVFLPIFKRLEADLSEARERETVAAAAVRRMPIEALLS